jgi:predicted nucleotidyltransferase
MVPYIASDVKDEVVRRLSALEAGDGVRLLLAVESGSRAWGFPSPDSDYDVRFVYVRPRDWYLQLEPGRDVIEQPISDEIDLSGWDIRKTLELMLKSNAVVGEWLCSPIRYRADDPDIARLAELAKSTFNPRGVAHHYANLGQNALGRWLGGEDVPVKRYFYALRPALAIRALRIDPTRPPPMNLQELVEKSQLPTAIIAMIAELVAAKSKTRELENACRMPELDSLIAEELSRAAELPEQRPTESDRQAANQFFLDLVNT